MLDVLTKKFCGITFFVFLMLVFFAANVNAQYFGRNKVLYDNFHFKILHTKHFQIYYYPEEEGAVKIAARMAELWYKRH